MKYFLPLLFTAITLISCKKDEPIGQGSNPLPRGKIHATIGNKAWDANLVAFAVVNGRLKISANPQDGSILEFDLNGIKPGQYLIVDTSSSKAVYTTDSVVYNSQSSYKGNVTITNYDTLNGLISGTFNLVLSNSISKKLLSVEDGVFTNVSLGILPQAFSGDTLYMAWLKTESKNGLYYILKNQLSKELAYRKILSSDIYKGGGQHSVLSPTGQYLTFPTIGVGAYFDVNQTKQLSVFVADSLHSPIAVNDKFFCYRESLGLYELNPTDGTTNLFVDFDSYISPGMTTDGNSIFLFDGERFTSVSLLDGDTTEYPLSVSGNYRGLECLGGNSFLSVKIIKLGSTTSYKLVRLDVVAGTVIESILYDLMQDNNSLKKAGFTYDLRNQKFYAALTVAGGINTQVSEVDLVTGAVETHIIEGEITGVEALY